MLHVIQLELAIKKPLLQVQSQEFWLKGIPAAVYDELPGLFVHEVQFPSIEGRHGDRY